MVGDRANSPSLYIPTCAYGWIIKPEKTTLKQTLLPKIYSENFSLQKIEKIIKDTLWALSAFEFRIRKAENQTQQPIREKENITRSQWQLKGKTGKPLEAREKRELPSRDWF